jgi:hypothetical protein
MILKAECPFCDWTARQDAEPEKKDFIRAYLAKALIGHLHSKHARHDMLKVEGTSIEFSSILGQATQQGMVEMALNQEITQMDLDKAREVHRMLGECIEAAISDWLIYKFMMEKVGMDSDKAARVLMDFRELRQGSKKVVNPN